MPQGVSMKRRKIDPETKTAAVLEGLKGESSMADICRKYQISESLYYRWRDKFLEAGSRALASRNGSGPEAAEKAKIAELERIMSKQAVKIEILKNFRVSLERYAVASELWQAGYLIQAICEVVGVSRSGFYPG